MNKTLNYRLIFEKYLQQIKSLRNPKASMPEIVDLEWDLVLHQDIFDFGGKELKKYTDIVGAARTISIHCLNEIIYHLQSIKHIFNSPICPDLTREDSKILFALQNVETSELLLFKEIEDCNFWKLKSKEPEYVENFMKTIHASSCKYVYLMFDYAYLQLVGHNDDASDPGRGFNVYSIKWFFETYYGIGEYERFKAALDYYVEAVNDYLGYIFIRSLTPNAMLNFRKITERRILKQDYEKLLALNSKSYTLELDEFKSIQHQFVNSNMYMLALGGNDFSESLVTAEWLYDSMQKSKAIDLTVVGIGYFKAVEQLLYHLICLHADEGRKMKKDYSFKDLQTEIELSAENISRKCLDTSIGSMANFYKDNLDILRSDLSWRTKKYIREFIFDYKNLRNGYSHKDNIHDWDIINQIREATFRMFFLMLGAQQFTAEHLTTLGSPASIDVSDYYKLCEYINFHAGNIFFIDFGQGQENILIGCRDMYSEVIDNQHVHYSGVYMKEFGKEGRTFQFLEGELPQRISLGKFSYAKTEFPDMTPVKLNTIFENGKFNGPSIVEEDSFDY